MGCSVPKAIFVLVLVVILSIFNITDIQAARSGCGTSRAKNIPALRRIAEQRLIACSASLLSTKHLKDMISKLEYVEEIAINTMSLEGSDQDKAERLNNEGFMNLISQEFLEDERVFDLSFMFGGLFPEYLELRKNPNSTPYEKAKKLIAEIARVKGIFVEMNQAMMAVHGDSGTEE